MLNLYSAYYLLVRAPTTGQRSKLYESSQPQLGIIIKRKIRSYPHNFNSSTYPKQ